MPRVHFVKKARKDYPNAGIAKGESYYWWKFRYGGKQMSKTPPKPSQLTQSAFLSQLYDLQERVAEFGADDKDTVVDFLNELRDEVENLASECQDSLDNMPYELQESSESGQLLQERIDMLEGVQMEIDDLLGAAESLPDVMEEPIEPDPPDEPDHPGEDATEEDIAEYNRLMEVYEEELGTYDDEYATYEEESDEYEGYRADLDDLIGQIQGLSLEG